MTKPQLFTHEPRPAPQEQAAFDCMVLAYSTNRDARIGMAAMGRRVPFHTPPANTIITVSRKAPVLRVALSIGVDGADTSAVTYLNKEECLTLARELIDAAFDLQDSAKSAD